MPRRRGTDADGIVELIDVYPDSGMTDLKLNGYQLMVANDVFRGCSRHSFDKPAALTPNTPQEFTIDLHTQAYTFEKGHRIIRIVLPVVVKPTVRS